MRVLILLLIISFIQLDIESKNVEAIYKVRINHDEFGSIPPNAAGKIRRVQNTIPNINFILWSTPDESLFKVEDKLAADFEEGDRRSAIITLGGNGIFYKDENRKIRNMDILGDPNVNVLNTEKFVWDIKKETKTILGYKCFKALTTYSIISKEGKSIEREITAWFTPEINISSGPLDLEGLPGLILEATKNKRYTFYASNIRITKKDLDIQVPKARKTITQNELDNLVREKLKQIRSQY
ncbi:GLPGLI family protein [Salegentibacter sp. HM20]